MKRFAPVLLVSALLVLGLLVSPPHPDADAAPGTTKWVYAELSYTARAERFNQGSFTTPSVGVRSEKSWGDLSAQYVKAKGSNLKKPPKRTARGYFFNIVGAQGWELVCVDRAGNNVIVTFKKESS